MSDEKKFKKIFQVDSEAVEFGLLKNIFDSLDKEILLDFIAHQLSIAAIVSFKGPNEFMYHSAKSSKHMELRLPNPFMLQLFGLCNSQNRYDTKVLMSEVMVYLATLGMQWFQEHVGSNPDFLKKHSKIAEAIGGVFDPDLAGKEDKR
jgi:hypothetical protein